MNWFGRSTGSSSQEALREANPLIPGTGTGLMSRTAPDYAGTPIDQVTQMRIERRPGGALVLATGVTDVIGYFDARLVAQNDGQPVDGVLTYDFKAVRPPSTLGIGTEAARTITVGATLTDQDLAEVRTIVVKAERNQRTSRR